MAELSELQAAVRVVRQSPHDASAWQTAEDLAGTLDRPDDIVEAFRAVVAEPLKPDVAEMIGERAGGFCDEWFGDDPAILEGILKRVFELAPQSDTALQRLSVIYTVAERWNDLLALYDRALTAAGDKTRRIRLLREASQLAKDVANQPEKAIAYQQKLLPLTPDDAQLGQSLERLLERHERWADLIALWESRLDGQSKRERDKNRARISSVWLDNLKDPTRALAAVRPLLAEAGEPDSDADKDSCSLLARIIESTHAARGIRDGALDLLRAHYDATARSRELIAVLQRVIAIDPAGSRALREEAGNRLADLDDVPGAMDHFAQLLAMQPESSAVEEKLRQLADRSGDYARYARGVADAAGDSAEPTRAVELLSKAAKTRLDRLQDTDGAIALYERAAMISGAAEQEQLIVVRRLNALYAQADRSIDRLMVLERQAALEPLDSTKNSLLSEAAKLAESLGQADRALALWEQRSDSDPADVSGLNARIALLESQGRWDDLVGTLENRAQKHGATAIGRADLIAVALVHEQKRKDLPAAIAIWQRVVVAAPNDADAVTALAGLFAQTERWREFADLISTATVREGSRTVERFVALGDAQRLHLGEPVAAAAAYRNAIAIDPNHEPALIGLRALLTEPTTRGAVADTLAATYARTGDVAAVLDLLPARLAECQTTGPNGGRDDKAELALLREAASMRLAHHGGAGRVAALADLARAFPMAPRDQMIEKQLLELGAATNDYVTVALAFGEAITVLQTRGAAAQDPDATRLRLLTADLFADHLGDREAAANLYFDVATAMPNDRRAVAAVVKHGSELGRWGQVASTILQLAEGSERFDDELWDAAQQTALARGHGEAFAHAIEGGLDAVELKRPVVAQFRYRLAQLRKLHLKDLGGAIVDLRRALEAGGDRASWLGELAALERDGGPSKPLLDALRRQSEAEPTNLNVLVEAADVASHVGDREQAVAILSQVLARAATAWRGTTQMQSDRPYEAVATWATEGLVDLHRAAGRPRVAMDTLLEASRLPYDDAAKRALRLRAADIATDELHDRSTAIDMYRAVLAVAPSDREILEKLASLLGAENRVGELLIIRQAQLANEADAERRLALRLETARLVGVIEVQGGRLEALQANLQERPGHEASLDAVSALLTEKAQHRELSNLLEKQSVQVEGLGEPAQAARLWARFADVAEKFTKEPERAIAGHRRVVALSPNPDSLRALARLNLERNQPAQAVPWLESLLTNVAGSERMAVVGQLARAHLAAKQPERAIGAIEQHLDAGEPAIELRQLLAELYRKNEQWEPLARHLTQSLTLLGDDQARRNAAREAATIYIEKLNQPARAIPALESALSIDPTDKDLRAQLAVGQRVSGKLPEARAALAELINDYGRRRSPERAVLHMELARVAQLEGKLEEAIAEMEQASKMDANNVNSQKELAEITRAAGQLDKAERSYRSLLLVVRRQPPGDDEAAVGQSEVLFELHKLAAQRGEAEQAKELLESALDAASQSDAEVRRFRRSLLAHNEGQLLLGVIEQRLKANTEAVGQSLLLSDMADVLLQLGRKDDALQAVIRATGLAPANTGLHEQARSLARDLGKTKAFVDAAELLADKLRRKDDPPLIADILMRAGLALEEDTKDLPAAQQLYRRVEATGEKLADAFYAQARIAGVLGDTDSQTRALDKMSELAGDTTQGDLSAEQVDALYRLADIFVATDARRAQGIDLLERAFTTEPRWTAAGKILRAAAATALVDTDERVLRMYERVARAAGDPAMLLDFLERRAKQPFATTPQIREAVDTAVMHGENARAEQLLRHAVTTARNSGGGIGSDVWSALALAERRFAAADLRTACELIYEVAPAAESEADAESVDNLAMQIAARAHSDHDVTTASEVYEFLRERHPADRAIWQPLIQIYREQRDADRLSSVVSSTLPQLTSASERAAMRTEHAGFLIDTLQRHHDALDILREGLADSPDDLEMSSRYEATLRHLGDEDGIAEFLWMRFDQAQRRGNRESTIDVALRLGDMLELQESADTGRVYRAALIVAPDDREILRRVVRHLRVEDEPREAAVLMERLLAVETPEHAPALAAKVAEMWHAAGDMRSVQRTLEIALRSAPDDRVIHDRLERHYRDNEMWNELAELMIRDSERMDDEAAVDKLREAASVYTGFLGQPRKAAEVLRLARGRSSDGVGLVTDQAAALAAAGDLDGAQRALGESLATLEGPQRLSVLLLRASFLQQLGDDVGAVEDCQLAYEIDAQRGFDSLIGGLERLRARAEQRRDRDTERNSTMRLARLAMNHGDNERARNLLVAWIERENQDIEPLYLLCDLDASIGHWEGVLAGATRLAYISTGTQQVDAAMRAAQAANDAGRPAEAVGVLEMVHQAQPDVAVLRSKLREQYEAAGAYRELAAILVAEADHSEDKQERYANYRRAAELQLYSLEDPAAATYAAGKALEMVPDDHTALMLNVDVLIGAGQVEDAGRTLDAAISAQKKRTPELAVMQQRMGRVSAMLGDKEGHLNWLKKAFDVDRKNAEVAAELATLATELGDYELALKPLRAITLMENPQPVTRPMALLWEAKIEHARGNRAKAELWAKKALREDPNFAEAQTFIDEMGAG